jgi:hypothetical protein
MHSLNKTVALVFSILLLTLGSNIEKYNSCFNSTNSIIESDAPGSYFSVEKFNFDLSYTQSESVFLEIIDLPVSRLKKNLNDVDFILDPPATGKTKLNKNYSYSSEIIYPNLTARDIVFPFHCFL